MDENEKKNLNGSIKSFIGDRLSKAKEKDVKEKSGDSVSSGTGIDRSNIRQPKAGFGNTPKKRLKKSSRLKKPGKKRLKEKRKRKKDRKKSRKPLS